MGLRFEYRLCGYVVELSSMMYFAHLCNGWVVSVCVCGQYMLSFSLLQLVSVNT